MHSPASCRSLIEAILNREMTMCRVSILRRHAGASLKQATFFIFYSHIIGILRRHAGASLKQNQYIRLFC